MIRVLKQLDRLTDYIPSWLLLTVCGVSYPAFWYGVGYVVYGYFPIILR